MPDAEPAGRPLPVGTVTFLLTDVESSTTGWESDRAATAAAVVRHYEILDRAVEARGGVRPVEQGEGDGVAAAFPLASDAVRAAVDIQLALAAEPWPDGGRLAAVRIALHTGEAQLRGPGNYMGRAVIRTARLRAIGHGGQILCSHATADLAHDDLPPGVALIDLGAHRLKDLGRAEHVYQVCHPGLRREFPPLRSPDAVPNNLPVHLTSFIGREAELREVARLAAQHRLVTLTGAGGSGKTRLAARIAGELAAAHADGAWWVELAPLAESSLVAEAVLGVLSVVDSPERSALQRLTAHLATRDMLLLLDNCEHVVEACAVLSEAVLRACPGVAVLATSREPLGVPGEVTWHVPPLGLPARNAAVERESLRSFDAVALFIDRAVRARPNFAVTNATAPLVAEICARLDGIPLAIELAAARVRVLSPRRILDGLENRFQLLTGGSRSAVPRQQTLEASVAWSHDLLSDDERVLFRRLSVFAGGFTLDAAEQVCPGTGPGLEPAAVLDLLDGLVAKSLVLVAEVEDGTQSRYSLLETIRDFAALQLARAGETAAARDAHLQWCDASSQQAYEALTGVTASVLARLAAEGDNYRTALDWGVSGTDPGPALRIARAHAWILSHRGRYREARDTVERVAALPGAPPALLGSTLWAEGLSLWSMGDLAGLQHTAERVLTLADLARDAGLAARGHQLLIWVYLYTDLALVRKHVAIARPLAEEAGERWVLADIACCEYYITAAVATDVVACRKLRPCAHALATTNGDDWHLAWNHIFDAVFELRVGRLDRARSAAERGIGLARGLCDAVGAGFGAAVLAEITLLAGEAHRVACIVDPEIALCAAGGGEFTMPSMLTVRARAARPPDLAALAQAVAVAAQVGDPWQHAHAALAHARGLVATDGDAGDDLLAQARELGRRLGSPYIGACADHVAALAAEAAGDLSAAENFFHAALSIHAQQGYGLGIVDCLESLAGVAAAQESWAEAVRLVAAAARRRDELGYRYGREPAVRTETAARAALGEEAFGAALADGTALSIDVAVAYASRARGERKRPSSGWASLTPTELEVAGLAAQGMSNAEIGRRLFITGGTAKVHLSHIYAKLGIANRTELAAEVTRRRV